MPAQRDATGATGAPADESTTVRLTPEQAAYVSEHLWSTVDGILDRQVGEVRSIDEIQRIRGELADYARRLAGVEEVKQGRCGTFATSRAELLEIAEDLMRLGADNAGGAVDAPTRERRHALREAEAGIAIFDQLRAEGER